jgi:hypothetical protein
MLSDDERDLFAAWALKDASAILSPSPLFFFGIVCFVVFVE